MRLSCLLNSVSHSDLSLSSPITNSISFCVLVLLISVRDGKEENVAGERANWMDKEAFNEGQSIPGNIGGVGIPGGFEISCSRPWLFLCCV
ncbi:hypothetical protein SLE2022_171090 [Rubroshorea leprosula]